MPRFISCVIMVCLLACLVVAVRVEAQGCSPSNYTNINDRQSLPTNFCAYTNFPFRSKIPFSSGHPAHIDATNTSRLQNIYAPQSGINNSQSGNLSATGQKPVWFSGCSDQSFNAGYPVYKASNSDPLIGIDCANTAAGCGNAAGTITNTGIINFRIPPYARPSSPLMCYSGSSQCNSSTGCPGNFADSNMAIIQPNGDVANIYSCHTGDHPSRDWQAGDVMGHLAADGTTYLCSGADGTGHPISAYQQANIVTDTGRNPGTINGGDDFPAEGVHVSELQNGTINHAVGGNATCLDGSVYPAYAGVASQGCTDGHNYGTGLPVGAHIWLDMTPAQVAASSAIPAYYKAIANAMHSYGMYIFDTGGSSDARIFTCCLVEDQLPMVENPSGPMNNNGSNNGLPYSDWAAWVIGQGGCGNCGDADAKLGPGIDFSAIAGNLHVLDQCYAYGVAPNGCDDSIIDSSNLSASIQSDQTQVNSGALVNLSWQSTNAVSCTANGGNGFSTGNAANGTAAIHPTSTSSYSVTCLDSSSNSVTSNSVMVQVNTTCPPQVATYYIAPTPTGNDPSPCNCNTIQSTSTPAATFGAVAACASGGSQIKFMAGTYNQRIDDTQFAIAAGTAAAHTIIKNYNNQAVTLNANATGPAALVNLTLTSSQYIEVNGFTLTGNNNVPHAVQVSNPATNNFLIGLTISGSSSVDIYMHLTNNNQILNNMITSSGDACFYLDGNSSGNLIKGNNFSGCTQAGIWLDQATGANTVTGNYVHDLLSTSTTTHPGIRVDSTAGASVITNNVVSNYKRGIGLSVDGNPAVAANQKIENNTIVGNTIWGLSIPAGITTAQVRNNLFATNTPNITDSSSASTIYQTNFCDVLGTNTATQCPFTGSPLFTTDSQCAIVGNFALQGGPGGSPAIDKGTTLATDVPTDICGYGRPFPPGGAYDIGAYESQIPPTAIPGVTQRSPGEFFSHH